MPRSFREQRYKLAEVVALVLDGLERHVGFPGACVKPPLSSLAASLLMSVSPLAMRLSESICPIPRFEVEGSGMRIWR